MPLPVKKKVGNFTLKSPVDHLSALGAVSIRVELAFPAPDRQNHSRAAGLIPHNPVCVVVTETDLTGPARSMS